MPWRLKMISRIGLVIATAILSVGTTRLAYAQTDTTDVVIAGAFGGGNLDGISRGLPPEGAALFGGLRFGIGWPLDATRFSLETELNWVGQVKGQRQIPANQTITNERRADLLWSFLGGFQFWEPHRVVSVHAVAGASYVKPIVDSVSLTYNPAVRLWTDPISIQSGYSHAWAVTAGADVFFTFGHLATGPTFRWHGYLQNPSPWQTGKPTRTSSFGFAVSYQF
jgi:hypothetical protein